MKKFLSGFAVFAVIAMSVSSMGANAQSMIKHHDCHACPTPKAVANVVVSHHDDCPKGKHHCP